MDIRKLKTHAQYRSARKKIERLAMLDPSIDSKEGARLELLANLAQRYEKSRFKFHSPDPADTILFRMEEAGGGIIRSIAN